MGIETRGELIGELTPSQKSQQELRDVALEMLFGQYYTAQTSDKPAEANEVKGRILKIVAKLSGKEVTK